MQTYAEYSRLHIDVGEGNRPNTQTKYNRKYKYHSVL